jgi:hypothetical protein
MHGSRPKLKRFRSGFATLFKVRFSKRTTIRSLNISQKMASCSVFLLSKTVVPSQHEHFWTISFLYFPAKCWDISFLRPFYCSHFCLDTSLHCPFNFPTKMNGVEILAHFFSALLQNRLILMRLRTRAVKTMRLRLRLVPLSYKVQN